jgi:heme/copper-type cytochrome/quinol oxidase subunit 3
MLELIIVTLITFLALFGMYIGNETNQKELVIISFVTAISGTIFIVVETLKFINI